MGETGQQKVAVITGGSQGIGAGLVAAYRQRGWAVVANSLTIKPSADPDILTVAGDVSQEGTAEQIIGRAVERFGRVDTLVNNAGIFLAKPFTDYTAADYALVTGVNLAGFFWLTQRAIGQMLKQGGGHVVNLSASVAGRADSVEPTALAALTKGGLAAVTRSLAVEYASRGIRVNAVAPGHHPDTAAPARVLHPGGAGRETAAAGARGPGQRRRRRHLVPGVGAVRHRRDPAHRRRANLRRVSRPTPTELVLPAADSPQQRSQQTGSPRQRRCRMPSQAMQDSIDALRDRQKASAEPGPAADAGRESRRLRPRGPTSSGA